MRTVICCPRRVRLLRLRVYYKRFALEFRCSRLAQTFVFVFEVKAWLSVKSLCVLLIMAGVFFYFIFLFYFFSPHTQSGLVEHHVARQVVVKFVRVWWCLVAPALVCLDLHQGSCKFMVTSISQCHRRWRMGRKNS